MKLDPKNTELLSQKQQVLSENIEETSNKLKTLQETYNTGVEQEVNGAKISEENWRALQREIIATEQKLKKLNLENSKWTTAGRNIEEFGTKVYNVSSKVENLGNKLSQVFTTSVLAIGTASAKSAMDFETAFAGVEKTVDGTVEQMEKLKQGIKDMSKEIPSTTTEISAVAEAAGQLGIKTENILSFSKAMIDLGNSTNLTSEEAASQLAKFANVMQMSQKDFEKLGSSIVDLGNNFATTEADIVNMAMRLAGAGKQVGFSEGEVLGLATALSSVGIEAEMGGSAISKAMVKMQNAVEMGGEKLNTVLKKTGLTLRELELMSANDSKGFKDLAQSIGMTSTEVKQLVTAGKNLEDFAAVSGMTAEQFKKAWREDASGALSSFIKGLGDAEDKGESAIVMLSEMGLTEVRLRDSLLRAANAGDLFNNAIETGTKSWEENTALTNEANKRYATLESRFKKTLNKTNNLAINLGNKLTPSINKVLDKGDNLIEKLDNLSEEETENIVKIGLIVAAAGPLVKILGKIGTTTGTVVKSIGTFSQAIGVMKSGIDSSNISANKLAKVLSTLTSPAGLAAIGITAAVTAITIAIKNAEKDIKEAFSNMGTGASDFYNNLQTAEGYLANFNETIFASSEEQENLQKQMEEIQAGITQICKTASDERRDYTQEEITQLDEYFQKLRELKDREIQIYQSRIESITQLAQTENDTFQGTLEEYKERGTQWIATAEDQAEQLIAVAENRRIEEIASLNAMYSEEERLTNENYLNAVAKAEESYQQAVAEANKQVGEVSSIYANGYSERARQSEGWYNTLQEYNKKIEAENQRNIATLQSNEDNRLLTQYNKHVANEQENYRHNNEVKKIWKEMYKNMDESEAEQLGVWLGMLANTELYGGEITEENQKMVDAILESYDEMPEETREAMQNAMSPMLEEMENSEPTLWAKASGIANGILSRLKKAFDIHSPSRETRGIFQDVMKGAELGLDDEEKRLNKQVDEITNKLKTNFENILPNMGAIKQSVIDQTKTIFTTPSIIINAQDELTPAKMNSIIDTVNRRLGSRY